MRKSPSGRPRTRKFDKEPSATRCRRANAACHAARHPYWPAQEITRITALFKLVELWVDGPVKELIAYIAPNNIHWHVYSCFTLGRDVGKEAVRIITETRNMMKAS